MLKLMKRIAAVAAATQLFQKRTAFDDRDGFVEPAVLGEIFKPRLYATAAHPASVLR
jgi:hypothetical protein